MIFLHTNNLWLTVSIPFRFQVFNSCFSGIPKTGFHSNLSDSYILGFFWSALISKRFLSDLTSLLAGVGASLFGVYFPFGVKAKVLPSHHTFSYQ